MMGVRATVCDVVPFALIFGSFVELVLGELPGIRSMNKGLNDNVSSRALFFFFFIFFPFSSIFFCILIFIGGLSL